MFDPDHSRSPRLILYGAMIVLVAMNLFRIAYPPNGYHQWRESDTAAVSMNFYQEDMTPWHARINQRGDGTGITGMELPIYNYVTAILYKAIGPHHAIPRLLTVVAACIALLFLYRIVTRLRDEQTAAFASIALAFSPLFYFYSHKIMPDILLLAFWLASIDFYLRYLQSLRLSQLLPSALLLILAAGIKPLVFCIYLPYLIEAVCSKSDRGKRALHICGYVLITFVPVLAWFLFARHLNTLYGSPGFYLGENFGHFVDFFVRVEFLKKLFLQWPFELWIGWVLVPVFLIGLYAFYRNRNRFLLWWLISVYIVFIPTAQHSSTHDYYTLIVVPPLAIINGIGLKWLFSHGNWRRMVAIMLVVAALLGAQLRMAHRFDPVESFDAIRSATSENIPREALVIVEDPTQSIRMYQINRVGWPLRFGVTYEDVCDRIARGGEYLILDNPIDSYADSLAVMLDTTAVRLGPLFAYRVLGCR